MKKILAIVLCIGMIFAMSACSKASPTEVANQFMEAIKTQDTTTMAKVYADEEGIDLYGSLDEVTDEEGEAEDELDKEDQGIADEDVDDDDADDNDADDTKDDNDDELDADEATKALYDKMSDFDYEITNEQIDGDKATVDVKITTYPIGEGVVDFIEKYMSQGFDLAYSGATEEEIEALGVKLTKEMLDSFTEKTFSKTAQLSLTRDKSGNWIVDEFDENSDIYDAITGGMVSTVETLNIDLPDESDEDE